MTQYAHRKYKNEYKQKVATLNALAYEDLLAKDLENGVLSLDSVIPNIREYIAPTLNVAYEL